MPSTNRSVVQGSAGCARIGLSIGVDSVVAVCPGQFGRPMTTLQHRLDTGPGEDGTWPELETTLGQLLAALKVEKATADIALLPPLAQAKSVVTPPVAPGQLDSLISRNLRRYFITRSASPVGRAVATKLESKKVTQALAVCADKNLVWSICRAVEQAGLRPLSLTAGPVALLEGLRRFHGIKGKRVGSRPGYNGIRKAEGEIERIDAVFLKWNALFT